MSGKGGSLQLLPELGMNTSVNVLPPPPPALTIPNINVLSEALLLLIRTKKYLPAEYFDFISLFSPSAEELLCFLGKQLFFSCQNL